MVVTQTVENYLKAMYKLQQAGSPATTTAIADQLAVKGASVTAMLQHLSEQGLADYTPYRGAYLTDAGEAAALRVIRRHRLIELYLHRYLDVPWDCVHDEAELLEHAISPYLEEKIDAKLGHPLFDPHGDPIPSASGELPVQELMPLYSAPLDTPITVQQIPDDDPEVLRYAASLGLLPGTVVKLTRREPFDGPAFLSVLSGEGAAETSRVVGANVAKRIYVSRAPATPSHPGNSAQPA